MTGVLKYLVVDLEATCSDDGSIPREAMEIIEIGAVMVCSETLVPIAEYQSFVRPVRHPVLTDFCRSLTSISQAEVQAAPEFKVTMAAFTSWFDGYGECWFCSWGNYDRNQFQQDCNFHGLDYPLPSRHLNIKQAYAEKQGTKPMGMARALKRVGLTLDGIHHRGIDDARNIAKLLPYALP